ncbi:unnamed protein product [Macrosiphum euphorbiae]|nr:unnamed protein product [Macrosiphum euphorbiae]
MTGRRWVFYSCAAGPRSAVDSFAGFRGAESCRCSAAFRSSPGIRPRLLLVSDGGDVCPPGLLTAGVLVCSVFLLFPPFVLRRCSVLGGPVGGFLRRSD